MGQEKEKKKAPGLCPPSSSSASGFLIGSPALKTQCFLHHSAFWTITDMPAAIPSIVTLRADKGADWEEPDTLQTAGEWVRGICQGRRVLETR